MGICLAALLALAACGSTESAFEQGNEHFQQGSEHALASGEHSQAGESDKAQSESEKAQAEFDKALEQYEAVLAKEPENVSAMVNLGIVYYTKGQLDQAISQYNKALADLAEAHFGLGVVYIQKGQKEDSIRAFERFLELDEGGDPIASEQAAGYLKELKGQ
jgi:tetratricopeptide (TPR) repeat protein